MQLRFQNPSFNMGYILMFILTMIDLLFSMAAVDGYVLVEQSPVYQHFGWGGLFAVKMSYLVLVFGSWKLLKRLSRCLPVDLGTIEKVEQICVTVIDIGLLLVIYWNLCIFIIAQ